MALDKQKTFVKLNRQLGLWTCIALVAGQIIGAGIFISPKGVLKYSSGSVGWALVVWAGCGVISTLGAVCFAELSITFHKSGGDFMYIVEALSRLLGFLRVWTFIIAIRPGSSVVIGLTMSNYLIAPLYPDCQVPPANAVILLAVCILSLIVFVNCVSVPWASRIQIVLSVAKILGLSLIIIMGLVRIGQGHTEHLKGAFESADTLDVTQIPLAFYSGLFAYAGWQYLPQITEEVENPSRNIPLSVVLSMVIVTTIYLLTNIAYFTGLSSEELLNSNAVATDFARPMLGSWSWIIQLVVALSCAGAINGGFLTSARVPFAASREHLLPEIFSMINVRYRTPLPSLCFLCFVCLLTLLGNDIFALIHYVSFSRWVFMAIAVAIIPYYRWKYPDLERPFKVPVIFCIIFVLSSLFLAGMSLYSKPVDCGIGLLVTLAGIPVYFLGVSWKNKPPAFERFMKKTTHTLQKLMVVVRQEVKTY